MTSSRSDVDLLCKKPRDSQAERLASRTWEERFFTDTVAKPMIRVIYERRRIGPTDQFLFLAAVHTLAEAEDAPRKLENVLEKAWALLPTVEDTMWTAQEVEAAVQSAVRPYRHFIRTMKIVLGILLCEVGLVFLLFILELAL